MLFSSLEFIFRFLPLFLICYFVMPERGRNMVLFLGSLIFYAIGEPVYVLLMLGSIVVNYFAARRIAAAKSIGKAGRQRAWLVIALVFDLGALFLFKYFDFFAENVNLLLHQDLVPLLHLTLPLGISLCGRCIDGKYQRSGYFFGICNLSEHVSAAHRGSDCAI